MSITAGWPCVSVPVLSKTTVSHCARRSICAPLLMMMPARAEWVIEASTEVGAATRMPVP